MANVLATLTPSANDAAFAKLVDGPGADDNRRSADRRSTLIKAEVVTDDGQTTYCIMHDVSATGAKIALRQGFALPDSFVLRVRGHKQGCRVHLAWRNRHYAGVTIRR